MWTGKFPTMGVAVGVIRTPGTALFKIYLFIFSSLLVRCNWQNAFIANFKTKMRLYIHSYPF